MQAVLSLKANSDSAFDKLKLANARNARLVGWLLGRWCVLRRVAHTTCRCYDFWGRAVILFCTCFCSSSSFRHPPPRRKAAKESAHKHEFKALESRGENPYKVFRQREVDAAARKAEKLARDAVKRKEEELVLRILKEDEWAQKRDKEAR